MDFRGRGNDFRPRPRGPNDGKFYGNEGLRITVPNSDPRLGSNFELGRSTGRPYFDGSDSGRLGENIRSDSSEVNSRAESIRITVGNEKFMSDQQRDPASRRLGPPVADNDPWGLKDLSAEEKLRESGTSRSAALSSAIDALLGKASLLNTLGNPVQSSTKPEVGQPAKLTFPILESNQRGSYEPRLDAKPLKPALKSCLKKPSEKTAVSSSSVQSEFNKSQDLFSSFGFAQPERKDSVQSFGRDLGVTQQGFGGDLRVGGHGFGRDLGVAQQGFGGDLRVGGQGFGRDLGVGQLQQSKSVEDEDFFLYGENNDSRSARLPDTARPVHSLGKPQSQLFPISLSPGTRKSDNFSSKSISYEQAPQEMPARQAPAEPAKEEAGLPNDPTIANILKSIGFDFEMSRKMQERAKQDQEEQERFRNAKKKKVPTATLR